MQRTAFVARLAATVGLAQLTCMAPALAVDEEALGREVFTDLRNGGEILFDSP